MGRPAGIARENDLPARRVSDHPVPLDALRTEIGRQRAAGARRIGLIGFSAGGHLVGLAALGPGAAPDEIVQLHTYQASLPG
jgi:dienelactone hydrolase